MHVCQSEKFVDGVRCEALFSSREELSRRTIGAVWGKVSLLQLYSMVSMKSLTFYLQGRYFYQTYGLQPKHVAALA